MSATIAAVRQAATFAERGGVVALLLGGHGDAQIDTTSTWVDLAPARHLRVTVEAVERAAAAAASSASDLESTALQDYGDALRYGGRRARRGSAAPAPIGIARVDLYACHLGVGTEGQRMLDALSALWGVTVRGLAGYMGICGVTEARGPSATVGDPFMLVTPPRRGQNRATCPEGVTRATPNVFVDRLPGEGDRVFGTDTPIWTTSRPRGRR
ncbi:MAG: hypothetical protein K8H88_31285 [Sandaracinaceae bacterium]|nr:hypothetical protein [Sandaracinaceae bacterium]